MKGRLEACNFVEKEILAQVFPWEFSEIFKNIFLTEHLWTTASERCKGGKADVLMDNFNPNLAIREELRLNCNLKSYLQGL